MNITTISGNTYSYIRRTNEIVEGIVEEQSYDWNFAPLASFSAMMDVSMFIIGITEQCNLRCTYCCYSGLYENNRIHSTLRLTSSDIDEILLFIQQTTLKRPVHIAFYGGEPLLQYYLIQHTVELGRTLIGKDTTFSITTNATLLTQKRIDWLMGQEIGLTVSLDGTKLYHDRHRVDADGNGSFDRVYAVLRYVKDNHPLQKQLISLQMTMPSYDAIEKIAEEWHKDSLLREFAPTSIHGLSVNFAQGVRKVVYEEVRLFYEHLIDVYEQHQDWMVLKVLLDESVAYWKNRPIMDASGSVPMATCMPVNTKLYIDSKKDIGVCEKVADKYRIGNVREGIDWAKANEMVREYYSRRVERCKQCHAIRMCNMCLTALEYSDGQWDVLCHNERVYARVFMFVFCEMAERGLVL